MFFFPNPNQKKKSQLEKEAPSFNRSFHGRQLLRLWLIFFLIFLALFISLNKIKQEQEIRKKAASTAAINLSLSPSSGSIRPGEDFQVEVQLHNLSDQPQKIMVAGVTLSFDSDVFAVSQLTCGSQLPAKALPQSGPAPNPPGFGVAGEKIYLTCFRYQNGAPLPPLIIQPQQTVVLGSFRLTVKDQVPSQESQVAFVRTNLPEAETLTNLAGQSPAATYSIETETLGEVKLKIKVRLAGVEQQRADQKMKIAIGREETLLQELKEVSFSADSTGLYQSDLITLSSRITAGNDYWLKIKGPKHLQSRYDSLTFQKGENDLDLSQSPLLAGDLPQPQSGQDGVVNAFDAVLLVNCFSTPEDSTCLSQADLNLDGIINSLDMNLMNLTLTANRWEDE